MVCTCSALPNGNYSRCVYLLTPPLYGLYHGDDHQSDGVLDLMTTNLMVSGSDDLQSDGVQSDGV